MRTFCKAAAIILFAALVAFASQTATAQAPEKRKVNVATASLGLPYLPLIIAQQRKYFADEGLEVEIAAFAGGSKALQSLMGGSSDVASGAYSNTLTMAAKGQKLKNFVVQVRYPALTIAVSKKVADRYKTPADLKGMKIGVSAPGSSTHMIVNHLLSKAGLSSNDVSIIGVGTSAGAVAAIEKGEIDAIINSDPVMTKLEADNAVTVIAETRTKATVDDIAANVPAEYMLGEKGLYLASYRKMREAHAPDGQITKEGAQIVHDVLAAFLPEVKAANIKVEDTYDNHFVEAALKKFQGKM